MSIANKNKRILIWVVSGLVATVAAFTIIFFLIPKESKLPIEDYQKVYFKQSLLIFDEINSPTITVQNTDYEKAVKDINKDILFVEHKLFSTFNNVKFVDDNNSSYNNQIRYIITNLNRENVRFDFSFNNTSSGIEGEITNNLVTLSFKSTKNNGIFKTIIIYDSYTYEVTSTNDEVFNYTKKSSINTLRECTFDFSTSQIIIESSTRKVIFEVSSGKIVCNIDADYYTGKLEISINAEGNYQYKFKDDSTILMAERYK